MVHTQSPELVGFVSELNDRIEELQSRFLVTKEYLSHNGDVKEQLDESFVEYLNVKLQLLLVYCINVVFYLYIKASLEGSGGSVQDHPLMKQLLQVRYMMENIRPLDKHWNNEVDELVNLAVGGGDYESDEEETAVEDGKEEDDNSISDNDGDYDDDDDNNDNDDMDEAEEIDQQDSDNGRRTAEEEEFERMTLTKRKKKVKKGASARLSNFEDIGNGADELPSTGRGKKRSSADASADTDGYDDDGMEGNEELMKMLMGAAGGGGGKNKSKRRPVPTPGDGDGDFLAEFGKKKKEFISEKKKHYKPAPRFGGREAEEVEGDKRAASYEIIKNKGLTPHRKKENRNARVKKKVMYEKQVKARKGQVREVITGAAGSYGGEQTGIKANIARSRKIY